MDAIGDSTVGVSSEGVAGLETEAASHIDFAELAIVKEFHSLMNAGFGAVLKTDRDDTVILAGSFNHFSTLKDIVGAGLFDVNVLSSLTSPYSGKSVPVVGGGDDDGVNVSVIEDTAEVVLGGWRKALDFLELFDAFGVDILVDVNEGLDADVGSLSKTAAEATATAPDADDGQIDTLVSTDDTACGSRGGSRGGTRGYGACGNDASSSLGAMGQEFAT